MATMLRQRRPHSRAESPAAALPLALAGGAAQGLRWRSSESSSKVVKICCRCPSSHFKEPDNAATSAPAMSAYP